jgi:hypothetical protein
MIVLENSINPIIPSTRLACVGHAYSPHNIVLACRAQRAGEEAYDAPEGCPEMETLARDRPTSHILDLYCPLQRHGLARRHQDRVQGGREVRRGGVVLKKQKPAPPFRGGLFGAGAG